jgi:manganese/zinc/iron transport system substrate-binding protein
MDISLWSENIPFIVDALSAQDPVHAEEYKANGERVAKELNAAHLKVRRLMQSIPEDNRYLVTSHDAFNYFTRAYLATDEELINGGWQNRFAAPEGLAPESQLSATDIQQIIEHLDKYRIHVVFPESNVSKDSIRKIVQASKEKNLNVQMADTYLYADAMGRPGSDGDTYIKMIEHNAKIIAQFLSQEKNHHAAQ